MEGDVQTLTRCWQKCSSKPPENMHKHTVKHFCSTPLSAWQNVWLYMSKYKTNIPVKTISSRMALKCRWSLRCQHQWVLVLNYDSTPLFGLLFSSHSACPLFDGAVWFVSVGVSVSFLRRSFWSVTDLTRNGSLIQSSLNHIVMENSEIPQCSQLDMSTDTRSQK